MIVITQDKVSSATIAVVFEFYLQRLNGEFFLSLSHITADTTHASNGLLSRAGALISCLWTIDSGGAEIRHVNEQLGPIFFDVSGKKVRDDFFWTGFLTAGTARTEGYENT